MKDNTPQGKAVQQYAEAHSAHYKTKDLQGALGLYTDIIADYPDMKEADYSRQQITNMAKSVVPQKELVDAETNLILAHLKQVAPPLAGQTMVEPIPAMEHAEG